MSHRDSIDVIKHRAKIRKTSHPRVLSLIAAALLAALWLLPAQEASAESITVTTTLDENDGCWSGSGCSLREALTVPTATQVTFDLTTPATITLGLGELAVNQDLVVSGPGQELLAVDAGGASRVFHVTGGAVTLSDLTVTGGSSDLGAGIYYYRSGGTLTVTHALLTGNHAYDTGGSWQGGGGLYGSAGEVRLLSSTVYSNSVGEGLSGGGAYVYPDGSLLIENSSFVYNSSQSGGGGITNSGVVVLRNSEILTNTAEAGGGGIVLNGEATLTATGATIAHNVSASGNGGGIWAYGASLTLTDTHLHHNTAQHGGGLYHSTSSFTQTGGTIAYNVATDRGGGIYVRNGSAELSDVHVHHNTGSDGAGMKILDNAGATLTNNLIEHNTATSAGGALSIDGTPTLLDGNQLLNNTAIYGGALELRGAADVMHRSGTVAHNSASQQGGVARIYDAHLTLEGGSFVTNTAPSGGGIHVGGASGYFTQTSGTLAYNQASSSGGGVYAWSGATVEVGGGELLSNTATWNGGGFYVPDATLNLAGGHVAGNRANVGGGVQMGWSGSLHLGGVKIEGNSATSASSALAAYGGSVQLPSSTGVITGDVYIGGATVQHGGAPYTVNGSLWFAGGAFHAPTAFTVTQAFTHTRGTYYQTQDVSGSGAVGFPKEGGVLIDPAGRGDLGSTEVVIRAGYGSDCTPVAGDAVRHCYAITPTLTSGVSPDVTFTFNEAELDDHACGSLYAYPWDGTWNTPLTLDASYDGAGRACSASPYSLRARDVTRFGDYVLASTLLSVSDVTVVEGDAGASDAVFTVHRSGAHGTSSVEYATAPGTAEAGIDYTALPTATLNFAVGETDLTVAVPVIGDAEFEPDETFYLNLANPTGAELSDAQGEGTIDNDDPGPEGLGPGGVGVPDGLSDLELWLRGDLGVVLTGGAVSAWQDQSGNAHDAGQSYESARPAYRAAGLNGQPVLNFDNDYLDLGDLSGDFPTAATLFVVSTITDTNYYGLYTTGSGSFWRSWNGTSNLSPFRTTYDASYPASLPSSGSHIYSLESSAATYELFHNGTSEGALAASYAGGTAHRIGYNGLQGDVAEVIAYNTALNSARRTLVENYLSARYDVALATNDVYTGDDAASGDFDLDAAGIGMESDGSHPVGLSAGLVVSDATFLQDAGDYLVAGHRVAANANTTADLPVSGDWASAPDPQRWLRTWTLALTDAGSNGGTVDLIFDLSEAGMGAPNFSDTFANYRLLGRNGGSGSFTDLNLTPDARAGDRLVFSDVDVTQLPDELTLGTLQAGASPTAVTLRGFHAGGGSPVLSIAGIGLLLAAVWCGRKIHLSRASRRSGRWIDSDPPAPKTLTLDNGKRENAPDS
jgi:CSLREA domain-containing protein